MVALLVRLKLTSRFWRGLGVLIIRTGSLQSVVGGAELGRKVVRLGDTVAIVFVMPVAGGQSNGASSDSASHGAFR